MNLAKRIRDLRYSKGWGPDELANRAKISRTALYQIERGNTSKPQAGTLRRISRALGVPLEILLDSTPVVSEQIPSSEGPAEGGSYSHAMISGSLERSLSSDRADELIEKFRMLLGSPLADGIARSSKNRSVCCRSSLRLLHRPSPAEATCRRWTSTCLAGAGGVLG